MPILRVATYNANSIRMRLDQTLAWLKAEAPDALCVQETKVQDSEFPIEAFLQSGWQVAYRGQKAHAGVAIISREPLADVTYGLDDVAVGVPQTAADHLAGPEGKLPWSADEARLIRGVLKGVTIVNTYVPQGRDITLPHFAYKLSWLERLRAYFQRHSLPGLPLLWLGDLNVAPEPIDIYDPQGLKNHVDFHPLVRAGLRYVLDWGLRDVFRLHHPDEPGHYTYWDYRAGPNAIDRNIGWRIDHIMATEPLAQRCTRCWIDVEARRAPRPSDHTYLAAEFEI
ncbi:MAG: exodeoxyribonuclease III [Anaerolineae bacterium]